MQKIFSCHDAIMYSHNLIVHNCCVCIAWRVIRCNQCQKRSCYFLNVIGPCAIMMSWHGNTFHNSEMEMSFSWNFHQWLHWKLTTSNAASDEDFIKIMTFMCQWLLTLCAGIRWLPVDPCTNGPVMGNFDGYFIVSLGTKAPMVVEMLHLSSHMASPICQWVWFIAQGPILSTWINFNPGMDK